MVVEEKIPRRGITAGGRKVKTKGICNQSLVRHGLWARAGGNATKHPKYRMVETEDTKRGLGGIERPRETVTDARIERRTSVPGFLIDGCRSLRVRENRSAAKGKGVRAETQGVTPPLCDRKPRV